MWRVKKDNSLLLAGMATILRLLKLILLKTGSD
jgi:hypothetical protein